MKRFFVGLVLGLVLACGGMGLYLARTIGLRMQSAREGWAPTPVLVLTRDVVDGHVLAEGDLTEVSYPEQFVHGWFVPPSDRRLVVGRQLSLPVMKGDALPWAAFARQDAVRQVHGCVEAILPAYQEAQGRAVDEALRAFSQSVEADPGKPRPVPAFKFGPDGRAPVLVVTQAVAEGARIPKEALAVRRMPRALVTRSVVPEEALDAVAGALAVVPLEAGDALRWQFLDDAEQPRSMGGCVSQATTAGDRLGAEVAREQARAFFNRSREGR
ncbi:SAF domain-containing protein [Pyxidicoccus sp. 3LFB2]